MTDMDLGNSRRALAVASRLLREAGIRRVWIEQGGPRGAAFLVETETPGPTPSDPPPEAVAALRRALIGLHAPRWQARDGSDIPDALVVCRVSEPDTAWSHGVDSIAWPPAEIALALERDVQRGGEHGRRLSDVVAELVRLEQRSGASTAGTPPESDS
ncbi:hypothetical protein [Falsiroseomonas oryziterrae]|uniref:hypothetical protein n=1 Tax=Falsiroseomonas oryziterrae TaxID=2911368 RepID=UPI001F182452|nr:hypothetical protein [Roseomonas sp. NPKOSM-4]